MKHILNMEEMQECINLSPFNRWLGLSISDMGDTSITLHLPLRMDMLGNAAISALHGGIMATIIDAAGSYAIIARNNHTVATIDLRLDYLLPVKCPGGLYVSTEILRLGRRVATVDMRVRDLEGQLVATGRGVYVHSAPKPAEAG